MNRLCVLTLFCVDLFCRNVHGENLLSVYSGDDVILPCRLDSEEDLQDQAVEWTKLEVKPDPKDPQGRVPFVYFYRNRKTMTTVMIESLIPRVSLDQDGLKRGDVTLKIRNVSLQDEGKYSCFIPGKNFRETVQLVVEPNGVRAPTMETSQVDIISTPDPGGDRIWISRSRPALWILLGGEGSSSHMGALETCYCDNLWTSCLRAPSSAHWMFSSSG
ncbi:myelin-oligodendrocyte glycoprotein-like isoform X1 [Oryzias latipes]|uniref:myelin-oligodendrocyte glycoprotein-like isoform X1 n=1 Tax=Oryzias latipes TaxID=8090 RepID=UPI000CE2738B|nr:myelin-oligodendrocyte glycoprotein-like isoform X1 [Oryzias latipes]